MAPLKVTPPNVRFTRAGQRCYNAGAAQPCSLFVSLNRPPAETSVMAGPGEKRQFIDRLWRLKLLPHLGWDANSQSGLTHSVTSGKAGGMACEPLKAVFQNHYFGKPAGH